MVDGGIVVSVSVDTTYPFMGPSLPQRLMVAFIAFVPLAAAITAIVFLFGSWVSWLDISLMFGAWAVGGLGISVAYHRLVAHGAFKASAPVRAVLIWMGIQTLQGGPATWAATHRRHHALSDKEGDPHSPLNGLWHSHFGWLWKGRLVHEGPAYKILMRDPVIRFFERTALFWFVMTFLIPGFIALAITGSWLAFATGVLWGGFVRVFIMHHVTWSINSICHTWGTRPYESPDIARNNVIFGLLGFGEGWHNNHHAFPNSAYLGHRWYQVDFGKYMLLAMKPFGLVHDLVVPSREERLRRKRVSVSKKTARSA